MTISYIQGNQSDAGAASSATLLLGTATVGNDVLVAALYGSTSGTLAISDNLGNTYVQDVLITNNPRSLRLYLFRAVGIATGSTTLTATITGGAVSFQWIVAEYSSSVGALMFDRSTNATGTSATTLNSGTTATTTVADEMLVGYFRTATTKTFTAGASFTGRNTANRLYLEDRLVAATGAYNATCTINAADTSWNAAVATYYEATGGGAAILMTM